MGMDMYGRKPTGERGEYFRNNVWWWHPLADYCIMIAPDICAPCKYWHTTTAMVSTLRVPSPWRKLCKKKSTPEGRKPTRGDMHPSRR